MFKTKKNHKYRGRVPSISRIKNHVTTLKKETWLIYEKKKHRGRRRSEFGVLFIYFTQFGLGLHEQMSYLMYHCRVDLTSVRNQLF